MEAANFAPDFNSSYTSIRGNASGVTMKKLSFIASLSGLLLVATFGASLLSAGPALAQGGGSKPASDVRVVNLG